MTTAEAIIAHARSYVGTRFRHQGRQPGVGLDCAGLVYCAFRDAGIIVADRKGYGRLPVPSVMSATLSASFQRLPPPVALQPADLLWLRFEEPQHLALFTGRSVIHAYARARKVVEHRMDESWRGCLTCVWRHPEVARE